MVINKTKNFSNLFLEELIHRIFLQFERDQKNFGFWYTYQRDPYGVFESTSGTRFASPERDPRVLIEGSIREIAQELAIGRFFTRRV